MWRTWDLAGAVHLTKIEFAVYFLRDKQGHELDALIETGPDKLMGIEIKSGATAASDYFDGLDYWSERIGSLTLDPWLIYGGDSRQRRERGYVVPWNNIQ